MLSTSPYLALFAMGVLMISEMSRLKAFVGCLIWRS
jgi:hypothetical protein